MCTRNQAEEILHSVYHACSPIFGRIHDAYLYGSYARGDSIRSRTLIFC